ncbi:hypothetical protein JNUCC77_14830 (plasmid) [Enterococcus alishanensis]
MIRTVIKKKTIDKILTSLDCFLMNRMNCKIPDRMEQIKYPPRSVDKIKLITLVFIGRSREESMNGKKAKQP